MKILLAGIDHKAQIMMSSTAQIMMSSTALEYGHAII